MHQVRGEAEGKTGAVEFISQIRDRGKCISRPNSYMYTAAQHNAEPNVKLKFIILKTH